MQRNTSATSKASKAKWWNFELLAESLVWYPGKIIDYRRPSITMYQSVDSQHPDVIAIQRLVDRMKFGEKEVEAKENSKWCILKLFCKI